jgi:diguanylate cyclase (GGDEF)-like protein/PAS domain S-box-containing protein
LVHEQLVHEQLVRRQLVRQHVGVTHPAGEDHRRDLHVRLVCLAAVAAGAIAVALTAATTTAAPAAPVWLVLAFVVALTAVRLVPIHLTHAGNSEALHLDEVFFIPMVILLAPLQMLEAVAIALLIGSAATRRGGIKLFFNVGTVTASTGAGIGTAHLLGVGGPGTWGDYAAAFVGGLVCCAAAALAVSFVIAVASGQRLVALLRDGARLRVAVWLGSLGLGTLIATVAQGHPQALALAIVPVALLHTGYSSALRQRRERKQADALYLAANRIHATVKSDLVRSELLASAKELLFAGSARIVCPQEQARPGALLVPLGETSLLEVADRATGGSWTSGDATRLQALAAVAAGALDNALVYEQMHAITSSLGESVLAFDESGVVTFANPAAETLLGWAPGTLVGREIAQDVDPEGRVGENWVHLPRLKDGETLRIDEHVVTGRNGEPLDVALTASPVMRDNEVVGAVVVLRDVRDRKALQQELVHQAFHDPLTGLPNRALFLDRLGHARARSARDGGTQAVLFVDVDRFKVVNDSLGHRIGDEVLQTVAARIVAVLRPSDTVARFGGDEFTVLLEQVHDASESAQTAERIQRALQPPVIAAGREVVVTVSIGIAVAEPGNAPGDLLAAADIAMYQAKSSGKNRYVVAAAGADELALARLDLEMELRHAITANELEVHYQPVVHAQSGALYGLEALVRWRHPTLGLLAPSHFMDVAEESGLVLPLGEWVLEQACIAAVDWKRRHPQAPLVMAVNLSARQFQQPDLCERVARVLESTGLDPRLLTLEITETVVMEDTEATLATLRALKQLKVRLSIDDFGTGYSSLSYLKRFPVDAVKIDKSFVDGLDSGPVDREIVQAVIRLATAVGMQTIAEGVETKAQQDELRLLGCSMLQGYLVSRPGTLDLVERTLKLRIPTARSAPDATIALA